MISLRLPIEIESQLNSIAQVEKISKSEIIKKSLIYYIENVAKQPSAYKLGEKYFGKYSSGISDRSTNHKKYVKEAMLKKHKKK